MTNDIRDNRFAFGDNWARFLTVLDDDRIEEAERSLREMLQVEHLDGKLFIENSPWKCLSTSAFRPTSSIFQ